MSHFFGFQSNERSLRLSQKPGPVTYGGMNGNTLLYAVVATATVGFSLFGYDQGLMSGIIASEQFNREFPAVSPSSQLFPRLPSPFLALVVLGAALRAVFGVRAVARDRSGSRL
jgi:hypothetical protein